MHDVQTNAREIALKMLAARDHSSQEVRDKLISKEFSEETAQQVVEWLQGMNYLQDHDFAERLTSALVVRGYGPHRIRRELIRRGVPEDLREEALAGATGFEPIMDEFIRGKLQGTPPTKKLKTQMSNTLYRRGFDWEDINQAFWRVFGEGDENS